MSRSRFNRVLLNLSGEALMGPGQFGIDPDTVAGLAQEIAQAREGGQQLCIVVGGGNIFRGLAAAAKGFDRASARSEEHTSELQSLMRISYAVFCLKKKNKHKHSEI